MTQVLILGGTGAIGSHIVHQLAQGEVDCVVTSRKERQDEPHVTYVQGNAHKTNFIRRLLDQRIWDVIVDFMSYSTEEFKSRSQLYLKSTKQYIFLSSSRVYAESKGQINEESPRLLDVCKEESYLGTDEYALKKARQEDILRKSGFTNWTIISNNSLSE